MSFSPQLGMRRVLVRCFVPKMSPEINTETGGVIKCPEELLLIKTLASVFICVDGLSADGTRNSSIFLYN